MIKTETPEGVVTDTYNKLSGKITKKEAINRSESNGQAPTEKEKIKNVTETYTYQENVDITKLIGSDEKTTGSREIIEVKTETNDYPFTTIKEYDNGGKLLRERIGQYNKSLVDLLAIIDYPNTYAGWNIYQYPNTAGEIIKKYAYNTDGSKSCFRIEKKNKNTRQAIYEENYMYDSNGNVKRTHESDIKVGIAEYEYDENNNVLNRKVLGGEYLVSDYSYNLAGMTKGMKVTAGTSTNIIYQESLVRNIDGSINRQNISKRGVSS